MKIFSYGMVCLLLLVDCVFAGGTATITYLNRWPTAAANVIAKVDNHVFYGNGEAIAVYDTTTDPNLNMVARASIHLTGKDKLVDNQVAGTEGISGVFYAGGFLYVACGNEGLQIFEVPADVSTFSSSNWKGTYVAVKGNVRASVRDVAVVGNYAYIGYYWLSYAGYDSGIQVIDVSDPGNPVMVGETQLPATYAQLKRVESIAVANGYAYVTDMYNGLVVFNLSNPTAPTIEAVCYTPSALDVSVSGNYAYLVCAGYGLQVVNVNPANFTPDKDILPVVAYCQYNSSLTAAASVEVHGNYAYVGDVELGLVVIDISNPGAVTDSSVVGQYSSDDQGVYRLALDATNQAVYLGDCRKGLQKINVSNPAAPAFLASVNNMRAPAATDAVFVDTATSYVFTADADAAAGGIQEGIRIFFAIASEDYISFLFKGMYPTDGEASDIYYLDGYLYVADGSAGLKIIDPGLPENTAEPVQPVLKGSCPIAGGKANGVFVTAGYAYVAAGTGGLKIVDVSNPASPVVVGEISGTSVSDARKVTVKADYAFVADGWNGLKIVDISNKNQPLLTGQYFIPDGNDLDTIPGCVQDVNVVGVLAYVAAGNEGIYVLDVSDTTNPTFLASYDAQPYYDVKGIHADRSDASEGVDLIWVANGTAVDENMGFFIKPTAVSLQRSGAYHSSGDVKDVFVVGDYCYLADGAGGFQALTVYQGSSNDNPTWDDNVVPVNIHRNGPSSGCFLGASSPNFTDTILRWTRKVF